MVTECFISVRDVTQTQIITGYRIVVTTDIPCHLYMRWSINPPEYHTVPSYRRGVFMHGDRYFCFTAYRDNEQEEPGDTLFHTFIKTGWPHCQTRYFYFWGMVGALVCKSTTAVFKKHFSTPGLGDSLATLHNRHMTSSHGTWTTARNGFGVHKDRLYQRPNDQLIVGTRLNASYEITRAYQSFHTTDLPPAKTIIAAQLGLYVTSKTGTTGLVVITKGLWDEPVTPADWWLQTDETIGLGYIPQLDIVPGRYNWIDFNSIGLAWLNNSDLMLKQHESFDWRKTTFGGCFGPNRHSQSFTPLTTHRLRKVKLRLKKVGDAGFFLVDLREAGPDGCQTGDLLAQDYSYAVMLSDASWGDWYEFTFPHYVEVQAGHTYAFIVWAPDGNASNRVDWVASTFTRYLGGHLCYSLDDGYTWTPLPTYGAYFIEYEVYRITEGVVLPRYKVGGTNLCIRTNYDAANVPPGPGIRQEIKYYSAQKGEGFLPILRVYFETP
ncbi:hypothetical protein ES703_83636 [subsurface metagenome]